MSRAATASVSSAARPDERALTGSPTMFSARRNRSAGATAATADTDRPHGARGPRCSSISLQASVDRAAAIILQRFRTVRPLHWPAARLLVCQTPTVRDVAVPSHARVGRAPTPHTMPRGGRMGSRLCLAAVFCLCVAGGAAAQQTGSVSGTVFDQSGAAVAGASVRISGDPMPSGRATTTTDSGTYSFSLLLPGEYVVQAEKPQAGSTKRTVLVQVDRDTQLDLAIGVTVQEALVVTAVTPIVDMRSTEVSFNFKDEYLRNIPLERNYRGLFQLIPGVPDNRSPVGPAAGSTRQDNADLIDGVNITNPGFGYLSTEVNELDIAEVNIKRAGVSAEFGRTAGAVTNAVTRSGTNQLSGAARIDWLPQELIGDLKDDAFPDPLLTTVVSPGVSLGGPVLNDKLFWYGSARYFGETRGDRVNKLNEVLPNQER